MRAANLIAHKAPESCEVDGLGFLSREWRMPSEVKGRHQCIGKAIRAQQLAKWPV